MRRHRELLRISQEDLADRADLDRTYVSGIERGARNPTLKIIERIAHALGVEVEVIFATAREIDASTNASTGKAPAPKAPTKAKPSKRKVSPPKKGKP